MSHAITLAQLLKGQGYRTLAVGKHHSNESLYDLGFDRFYGFHYGEGKSCANHFNPGLQREGEGVPARKQNETRAFCFDDKKMLPYYTPKEKDWYTTDYFTKWAIDFLEEYKDEEEPYFLYLSYTAPHDPLHAWPRDIEKYEGVYEAGYEAIRAARQKRQEDMNLFGERVKLSQPTHREWNALSAEEKADQVRRMQVYAAMIDCIDQNIGKLRAKIKALGQEENTLIMFASDNGSAAGVVKSGTGEIGSLTRWASLKEDWANVSNTPFRYWKNLSYEGGIRTPFIAYWPEGIQKPGSFNHQATHFVDVMATLQELTGAQYPEEVKGKRIVPMQGESFLPAFRGGEMEQRAKPIFYEYATSGAIRDGKWKLVTKGLKKKRKGVAPENIAWQLYDMEQDMTEMHNLAPQYPDVVQRLSQAWRLWYNESYGE